MSSEVAEVLRTVRSLPRDQIADLAYQLIRVLDGDVEEVDRAEVDAAWHAELHRRVDDLESGRTTPVSHEETVAQARAMLEARRK